MAVIENNKERYDDFVRCTRLCLLVNIVLVVLKLGWGHLYASKALFADGIHSLLDVSTDVFVLYAIRTAHMPQDVRHPYGYFRYETLANIVVALALISAALGIIFDGAMSLQEPVSIASHEVIYIALISIVINEFSYRYTDFYARKHQSDLLKSTAVHQRADAGTSAVVLVSALCSLYGMPGSDAFGALIIAVMIIYYAVPSLLKSIRELLDCGFKEEDLKEIEKIISSVPGVRGFHLLRTRYMAKFGYIDVHVVVPAKISVSEGHYIGDEVRLALLEYEVVQDVTVHIDSEEDEPVGSDLPSRQEIEARLTEVGGVKFLQGCERLVIHYFDSQVELEFFLKSTSSAEVDLVMSKMPDLFKGYHIWVSSG